MRRRHEASWRRSPAPGEAGGPPEKRRVGADGGRGPRLPLGPAPIRIGTGTDHPGGKLPDGLAGA